MKKKYRLNSNFILLIPLFIFVFFNWYFLSGLTSLAPPDYYKYYNFSEKLFSADFANFTVPPLFPFLLGSIGNILLLFLNGIDTFIIGGKIISLLASLGIVYFSYKFFRKFAGKYSVLITFSLVLFPFFLKFMSLPLTDILYLFFVVTSFYYFSEKKIYRSAFNVILAILTRYEAILIVFSLIINFLKIKTKNLKTLIPIGMIILSGISVYLIYSKRFIKKIEFIIANKSYLFFFLNPVKLASLFYLNILFFIPGNIPVFIKIILFLILFWFLIYGYFYLFKVNKKFMLSLLFYQVFFIISKGYIVGVGNVFVPGNQARRMLSVIFIFWLVSIIGFVNFLKKVRNYFSDRFLLIVKFFSLFIVLVLVLYNFSLIKELPFVLITLFILGIIFTLYRSDILKSKKIIGISIILLLFLSMYSKSYNDSNKFIISLPNKGAYMISKWINANMDKNEKLLSYSSNQTVRYYLKKKVLIYKILLRDEKIHRYYSVLRKKLWEKLKNKKIKYLAFDLYMNPTDSPYEVAIKRMFYRYRREKDHFKLKRLLFYKGRAVATILEVM